MERITCENAKMLLDEKLDGVINEKENALLEQHLCACESCRQEYEMRKKTCAYLHELAIEVPSDLHTRVMASIQKEPQARPSAWRYLRPLSVVSVAALLCLSLLHTPLFKAMFSAKNVMEEVAPDQNASLGNCGDILEDNGEVIPLPEAPQEQEPDTPQDPEEIAPNYVSNAVKGTSLSLQFTDTKNAVLYRNENGKSEALLDVIYSKAENVVTIEKDEKKASLILEGDILIPTDEAALDALLLP